MFETKKKYFLKKPHQPIQSKPHWFGLVWLEFYFKSQPNQTKPHTYLSCGSDDFYPQNRTKPNREHLYYTDKQQLKSGQQSST